ncbi:MAG: phosphate acetyltransferase [Campylobacterales bacterium]|nr:phosphate acetyltransferase [Campylobacterales bacterium]
MQLRSLYIIPLSVSSGSISVSLGFLEFLFSKYSKVSFFKPIVESIDDEDIKLVHNHFHFDTCVSNNYCFTTDQIEYLLSCQKLDFIIETIINKQEQLLAENQFVLLQGDFNILLNQFLQQNFHLNIAKNLGSGVVCVFDGFGKSNQLLHQFYSVNSSILDTLKVDHFCTIINKIEPFQYEYFSSEVKKEQKLFTLPYLNSLEQPKLIDLLEAFDIPFDITNNKLNQDIIDLELDHKNIKNQTIFVCDDTTCEQFSINHIRFNSVQSKIDFFDDYFILYTTSSIGEVFKKFYTIKPSLHSINHSKIANILKNFYDHIEIDKLSTRLKSNENNITTPLMFEHKLLKKASEQIKTIVLPESEDDRILQATAILTKRKIVNIILLGNPQTIIQKGISIGLDFSNLQIIDPQSYKDIEALAHTLYTIRSHKGMNKTEARNLLLNDKNYFGTMLVYMGICDGMVSGAIGTTANTIRPALQIIKTDPSIPIVSSSFLMCMDTKVLVFADCAINQNPTPQELCYIAQATVATACQFEIEPKVAFLSYSTANSCESRDTAKVYEGVVFAKNLNQFAIDGPMQYDAAVDIDVAKKKMPNSKVAGNATVLIFPDLNTGNNTYKAVQRSSGAVAIGPILQGLQKPINDLSRGCSVKDIINTIAITAIQAQNNCTVE